MVRSAAFRRSAFSLAKAFASFCYGGLVNQGWYDPAIAARAVELAKEALADDRVIPTAFRSDSLAIPLSMLS